MPYKQRQCQCGAYIEQSLVPTCTPPVRPSRDDGAPVVLLGFQFLSEEACLRGPVEQQHNNITIGRWMWKKNTGKSQPNLIIKYFWQYSLQTNP